ncbi:MAG: hypothetical protein ACE5I3_08430 [Phycisphaerae bacterium]
MSGDFGMVYPLWTDPQGPGKLLDQVIGEVGLDHLTFPVVTGRQEQFRLSPAHAPHAFITEGGWHFPPNPACYTGGSVRPRGARWFGKRNTLRQLCEYAAGRNISVIFRVDLRAVTSLAEHEPHLRTRNAWGEEVSPAGPCTSNPDLRELLHGTLEDLLGYAPGGYQLVDWAPDLAIDRSGPRPLEWQPLARKLLDICFCPACRQVAVVAGADADQAARSVQVHVKRLLVPPQDSRLAATVREDEVLDAYLQAKRHDSDAWLRRLAETRRDCRRYLVSDAGAWESIGPLPGEETFALLLRSRRPFRTADEDALSAAMRLSDRVHGLTLAVWRPAVKEAGQLVRAVSELTRAGIHFFDFEGLDEGPEEAITWLRQAVRFARRG